MLFIRLCNMFSISSYSYLVMTYDCIFLDFFYLVQPLVVLIFVV